MRGVLTTLPHREGCVDYPPTLRGVLTVPSHTVRGMLMVVCALLQVLPNEECDSPDMDDIIGVLTGEVPGENVAGCQEKVFLKDP